MGCHIQKPQKNQSPNQSSLSGVIKGQDIQLRSPSIQHQQLNDDFHNNQNVSMRSKRLLEVRDVLLGRPYNNSISTRKMSQQTPLVITQH